ncbi:ribose 1,5-bisphosphokinase [Rhodovulum imhoffii]|uniref:Ribose 1,5-bisphosphate phosphokinase PhnN n=1 Tax=Rhodovulum imhoffii TaxID=365340 RepID=A0A2T5BPS1_9RHOB|nr:ribose 1,5-bisphosphokinase [Rhodovulum imhoffii]
MGRVFAIVGPSGVGKDTLMAEAAKSLPALHLARRVITRPAEAGGEPFESVTEDEFHTRRAAGAFALHWQAHGLYYGIPAQIDTVLAEGRDVLFNGSRAILAAAQARYPGLSVLNVTARPETLAARLAARGRESRADIVARLARAGHDLPLGLNVREISNDGPLDRAVAQLVAALQPVRV